VRIREGQPLAADDELIVDPVYAQNKKVKVGDQIELFNRKFRLVGIYEPAIGSRMKIRLNVMQQLLGAQDRCSFIYVKCQTPAAQAEVARNIIDAYPGNKILFTRDIQSLYERGLPALNTFIKVVIGVSLVVSTLVIMLAMYTTITERTREIGILKSMGASKSFIISTIEKEALLISALGVLAGFLVAFTGKLLIMKYTSLLIEMEMRWLIYAALFGLLSGLLGALYPALRAANQDPIKALSYE
jgi:putative ABC transport system permease protein